MRYATPLSLDPTALTPFVYNIFRANSVYDPDATNITGTQPMGYDQWSTFYPNWCVIGSKIRVSLSSTATNVNGIPAIYGVYTTSDTNIPAYTNTNLIEQPGVSWRQVPSWGGTSRIPSVSSSYSPRKWWGTRIATDDATIWGQTTSNPSRQTYFVVWAAAADGSSNLDALYGIVTIDYLVKFRNPNMVIGS